MASIRTLACIGALCAAAVALAPAARAATYKWVDDKGEVHYSDQIPPEAVNKANVQLNKQGVPVKSTDAAPTAEQRKAKADEEERQKQLAKEKELIDRRDKALLATYTMESEIELARRRALSTIEQQIQSSTASTEQLTRRKQELEAKKAAAGDKGLPPVTERELASINVELAKQADLVAARQKDVVLVNVRYDADRKRWRELRAAAEAQMNGKAPAPASAPPAPAATAQK